jgi:hypothetical protein
VNSSETSVMSGTDATRDPFVDFLRGICILSMILTHIGQGTLARYLSLGGTVGFFSGAEGFFFLSGLVFGRVYRRRMITRGLSATGMAIRRRVLKLYLCHVVCIGCMLLAGLLFPRQLLALDETYRLAIEQPAAALLRASLFFYQPNYLDILPLYIAYLPLAWLLIRFEWDSSPWVPIASLALWIPQQSADTAFGRFLSPGGFNVLSYQLVFLLGLWTANGLRGPLVAREGRRSLLFVTSAIVVSLCFLLSHSKRFGGPSGGLADAAVVVKAHCDKFSLGWVRLLNFVAMAILIQRTRPWLGWIPQKPIAALGRRSLGVFTGHVLLIIILCGPLLELRRMPSLTALSLILGLVTAVVCALCLLDYRSQALTRLASASKDAASTNFIPKHRAAAKTAALSPQHRPPDQ